MSFFFRVKPIFVLLVFSALLSVSGCRPNPAAPSADATATAQAEPLLSATPPTPSATPLPLAAQVNEGGVLLSDFEAEVGRYQAGQQKLGREVPLEEARRIVLDELINQELLAQAALEAGQAADPTALQARVEKLAVEMGGQAALDTWMSANGYTRNTFEDALLLAILAAWQRDQIIGAVPLTAEHVHARQIFVLDAAEADHIAAELQAGADFTSLALRYDTLTGGELGWFPSGTLLQPEVEEGVFALQAGQISPVIQSAIGYHIVQVSEREPERVLDAANRQKLQERALKEWLEKRRGESQVTILVQ